MTRHEQVCKWLQTLSPREEHLLRSRFGIGSDAVHPLRPDDATVHLSAQQTLQMERRGLRQLRGALSMIDA